ANRHSDETFPGIARLIEVLVPEAAGQRSRLVGRIELRPIMRAQDGRLESPVVHEPAAVEEVEVMRAVPDPGRGGRRPGACRQGARAHEQTRAERTREYEPESSHRATRES